MGRTYNFSQDCFVQAIECLFFQTIFLWETPFISLSKMLVGLVYVTKLLLSVYLGWI